MRLFPVLLLPLLALSCGKEEPRREPLPAGAPTPMVIDAETLRANREEIVLVDMQSKPEDFAKAHIPGAVYASLEDFRTKDKYLAPVADLEKMLGSLGIREDSWVVAYDEKDGRNATWLWYTLHQLGHVRFSLLDGNMRDFKDELEGGTGRKAEATTYVARKQPEDVVDLAWVKDHGDEVVLLDTRPIEQFTGEKPKKDMKAGHIPGSLHFHRSELLREDGSFLSVDEAEALDKVKNLPRDKPIVVFCNTYHDGAHMHWQLARLGFTNIKAWDGGFAEYTADESLPLEMGEGGGQ